MKKQDATDDVLEIKTGLEMREVAQPWKAVLWPQVIAIMCPFHIVYLNQWAKKATLTTALAQSSGLAGSSRGTTNRTIKC